MSKRIIYGLLASIITALIATTVASAQTVKIGVVDIEAVGAKYKEWGDRQEEMKSWEAGKQAFFKSLEDYMFLSREEFEEASGILKVPQAQWTEAQKKREGELRNISVTNEKNYTDLQSKPARTAEEQNRFNTLRDVWQAREMDMRQIGRGIQEEIAKRRGEVQGKVVGNVKTVIQDLGKARGFTLIVDKATALYSGAGVEDLTEDVLKALNTTGAAAPAAPPAGAPGAAK